MKTEAVLIQILEDVIGIKNVSRDARFLDIGGNSLNLVQVLKQIKEKFGVSPAARIFFDKNNSTVAAISSAIDAQLEHSRSTVSAAD
jgi:acyl carrier protein